MIESVINLGIKGSELVASRLRAIQDGKKKIEKKTDVTLNIPKKSDTGTEKPSSNILQRLTGLETVEEKAKRDSEENKKQTVYSQNLKSEMAGAKSQAVSSTNSFNGTGLAQAGIKGVGSLAGPLGTMAAEALNGVIDAVVAFSKKMKEQGAIVADTAQKNSDIFNKLGKKDNAFKNIAGGRTDISKTEQAAFVNAVSSSMGNLSNDFQKSISTLMEKNGKATDVNQAQSLAQGNFSALGNDKGFFMQQISSGFGGLPPSMKQALTSQMFDMIEPDDLYEQKDVGIRGQMKRFDELDRSNAQQYLGKDNKNLDTAYQIQQVTTQLDLTIAKGMEKMIGVVSRVAAAPDINRAMMAEFKGAVMDLKNSITGMSRGGK